MIAVFQVLNQTGRGDIYIGATKDVEGLAMKLAGLVSGGVRQVALFDGGKTEADEMRHDLRRYNRDIDGWFVCCNEILNWIKGRADSDTSGLVYVGPLVHSSLIELAQTEGVSVIEYFGNHLEPVVRDLYQQRIK